MGTYEHEVAELQDLASRLTGLAAEFDGLDHRLAGYEADVGHHDVAKALHDFADNWSDKREKLLKEMKELAGYVTIAAETYAGVEDELAGQYAAPPGPPPPPVLSPGRPPSPPALGPLPAR